jgi:hypothetical protein
MLQYFEETIGTDDPHTGRLKQSATAPKNGPCPAMQLDHRGNSL